MVYAVILDSGNGWGRIKDYFSNKNKAEEYIKKSKKNVFVKEISEWDLFDAEKMDYIIKIN